MSRATDAAAAFLRQRILRASQIGSLRLDTHAGLARAAGVGAGTMLAAVRRLVQEGLLVSRRKSGIRLAGAVAWVSPPAAAPGSHGVAARVREEILAESVAGAGGLTPKELTRKFGVCYRTARRALQELVDEGIVRRVGRSYHLTVPRFGAAHAEIVLVGPANRFGRLEEFTGRARPVLGLLERACVVRSMRLSVVGFDYRAGRFVSSRARRSDWSHALRNAAGCAVLPHALPVERLQELADACGQRHVPLAIVDDAGGFDVSLAHIPGGRHRVFRLVLDVRAGMQVGAYLKHRGHRAAAFLSPFHGTGWSQGRHDGLLSAMGDDNVTLLAIGAIEDLSTRYVTHDEALRALRALTPIRPYLGAGHQLTEECTNEVRSVLFMAAHNEILRTRMRPLFEQALAERRVTVWVAANDEVALAAMDFLHERGLDVPSRVSLIGFDNSAEALARRLSSYSFNEARAVDTVMRYLLAEAHAEVRERHSPAETAIDGVVVDRDSVGDGR
jgi:DNA-binding LacI/PurR family transcriptional regulator/DNA-binding transcriptional regulator YhcF (GntR family)